MSKQFYKYDPKSKCKYTNSSLRRRQNILNNNLTIISSETQVYINRPGRGGLV